MPLSGNPVSQGKRRRKMTHLKKYLSALVVLGLAQVAVAQLTSFQVIDYPASKGTTAYAMNDAGDVVGTYKDERQLSHGFLLRVGEFTTIDYPGAAGTQLYGVNGGGDIAGVYVDSSGKQHGFLLSHGTFKTIDVPGADQTMPYGLNSRGDVTGMYFLPGDTSKHYGFVMADGRFTTLDYPLPNDMSCGTWISDSGEVAGHVQEKNGAYHGYLWKDGKFTLIDLPGIGTGQFWDSIYGINAAGDILGAYSDARGKQRAFLRRKGAFTTFDMPGSQRTRATGMNRSGQVVGMFVDSNGVNHGFLTQVDPPSRSQLLRVDDDGAECPGALRTIQEAVAQASPGATILVCPGIYQRTVNIAGPEKNGLKLIATGGENAVVLQGDYTERDGFHLENVSNVLVRGFTVRDFGNQATTATDWGAGNLIYLENAHYNTIEQNRLINGDMMGIMLMDSGNNSVRQNVAFVDNANLANCGIHVQGTKSAGNDIRLNMTYGNKFAGIMIRGAGPGNYVMDNTVVSNGRFGIDVENTNEIWIEGNRVSYNRGFWGTTPGGTQPGLGINLVNVNKATVFDNRLRGNTGADLNWDGKGENKLEANACETSSPVGACRQ
jgi:parallel beta-helix repeat protein